MSPSRRDRSLSWKRRREEIAVPWKRGGADAGRIWSIHLSGENATTANNAVVFSPHALCRQVRQSRALKFDRYSVGRSFSSPPPPRPSITLARAKKRTGSSPGDFRFVDEPPATWRVFQDAAVVVDRRADFYDFYDDRCSRRPWRGNRWNAAVGEIPPAEILPTPNFASRESSSARWDFDSSTPVSLYLRKIANRRS